MVLCIIYRGSSGFIGIAVKEKELRPRFTKTCVIIIL